MRCSILGFNQAKVMNTNLDLTDLVILQYIMQANGSPDMKHILVDGIAYVWLSHSKIHEDLPILGISEGTLRNRLLTLKQEGWIDSTVKRTNSGSLTFYSITLDCMSLINDMPDSACNSKMTSDSKLEDSKLNNNIISKDIISDTKRTVASDAETTIIEKPKKKNLFDKCMDEIDSYTDDVELRIALLDYLTIRLAIKDKPLYGLNQWKGMLNKLTKIKGNKIDIVKQSIEKGWCSFYDLQQSGKQSDSYKQEHVFSEYGQVKSVRGKEEDLADVSF